MGKAQESMAELRGKGSTLEMAIATWGGEGRWQQLLLPARGAARGSAHALLISHPDAQPQVLPAGRRHPKNSCLPPHPPHASHLDGRHKGHGCTHTAAHYFGHVVDVEVGQHITLHLHWRQRQ